MSFKKILLSQAQKKVSRLLEIKLNGLYKWSYSVLPNIDKIEDYISLYCKKYKCNKPEHDSIMDKVLTIQFNVFRDILESGLDYDYTNYLILCKKYTECYYAKC